MANKPSKITLSAEELELVTNSGWIKTKQEIIKKVICLFGAVHAAQQNLVLHEFGEPEAQSPFALSAKIARGEQYLGLPYVVLDYPRCFQHDAILAIRTIFWWGNFFSTQLLLQGACKEKYGSRLLAGYGTLRDADFSICVSDSPWHHHFERDNFLPIGQMTNESFNNLLLEKPFIKVGNRIGLEDWLVAEERLVEGYGVLIRLLSNQAPSR